MDMNTRLADNLRDQLEEDILVGHFKPGDRLDEASLCERFGVSRTPIRETLAQLASSGLVELRPRRGAFVREVSIRELLEMFDVMAELESMCVRLAARRMNRAQHAKLIAAHEACQQATVSDDADAYYYCNQVFHQVIYDACGNGFLCRQTEQLRNRLKPYRRMQLHVPHRVAASLREHQVIVDALLASDEAAASEAIRAHVIIQGERFYDFISSMPEHSNEQAVTI